MAISSTTAITITAAGQQSLTVNVSRAINASFNVVVTAIGTNLVLRAEFSFDGTTWSNCNTTDTTITTNGQYSIPVFINNTQYPFVRLNWISTSGGTPTVTGVLRMIK